MVRSVICFLLLLSSFVFAGEPLSWKDCVLKTLTNNPELKSVQENLNQAQFGSSGSLGDFFPQILAQANYKREDASPLYGVSLVATQNLFLGLQTLTKIKKAKLNERIAEILLRIARAKVSFDLKTAFENLIYAQGSSQLSKEIILRREENFKLVKLRYESGRENKGSVLLAQAYLAEALYEKNNKERFIETARAELSRVLGEENQTLEIRGELPPSFQKGVPDIQKSALQTPEYERALVEEAIAQEEVGLAFSTYYPQINLFAIYEKKGPTWFPDNNIWSLGLNFTLPLFSGGKDYFQVKGAKASLLATQYNLEATKRQILLKFRASYDQLINAFQKLNVDRNFLEAAQVRSKIAKSKYHNGLLSFEDWDKVESEWIVRQKEVLQGEKNLIASEAAWEQIQGKEVFHD